VKPVKDMCEVSIGLIFSLSFMNLCCLPPISRNFSSSVQS
jgi:hypothetical protein